MGGGALSRGTLGWVATWRLVLARLRYLVVWSTREDSGGDGAAGRGEEAGGEVPVRAGLHEGGNVDFRSCFNDHGVRLHVCRCHGGTLGACTVARRRRPQWSVQPHNGREAHQRVYIRLPYLLTGFVLDSDLQFLLSLNPRLTNWYEEAALLMHVSIN